MEIAERYTAGDIDRSEMIRQLSAWPYAKKQDSTEQLATEWKAILPPEGPGTFDEMGGLRYGSLTPRYTT